MPNEFDVMEAGKLNQIADNYGDVLGVEERQNRLQAEYVVSYCDGKLLEMGVGNGVWIDLLVNKCEKPIDVVDAVDGFLAECKLVHGSDVNFFHSLFEDFEPETRYDTINMAHILEHVADPVAVLKRAGGWLKPTGVINVLVPHAGSIHRRLGVMMGGTIEYTTELNDSDKRFGHRRVYNLTTLRRHIRMAGLKVVFGRGLGMKPLHNAAMEDWTDEMLVGAFKLGHTLPIEFASALFFRLRKGGE